MKLQLLQDTLKSSPPTVDQREEMTQLHQRLATNPYSDSDSVRLTILGQMIYLLYQQLPKYCFGTNSLENLCMARTTSTIKNITTSFRITADMDRYIGEAADRIGASKGEIYRLGAYETAKQILTDQHVAQELSVRFAI